MSQSAAPLGICELTATSQAQLCTRMGGQPASSSSMDAAAAPEGPTVDSWSDKDQRIVVSQPAAGFLYDLVLRAKIDADPDKVYEVLIDPKSHEIFRGIKATLSRTTLEDDGKGRRKLRIGHRALTKFLWISVTFDTELYVWENDVDRTIKFTNARSDGFMSKFDGTWHVQPFTQQTLDSIYKAGSAGGASAAAAAGKQQHSGGHNWLGSILHHGHHSSSSDAGAPSALVTLNQALCPRARPPGPVAHLVRGLCGRVLHNMMADLRAEVARREQLEAAAADDAGHSTGMSSSKSRQQVASRPALPVASLTLSSSSSSSSRSGSSGGGEWQHSSSKRSNMSGQQHGGSDGDEACGEAGQTQTHVLHSAGQALQDLLTTAVPLRITVKL